MKTVPIIGLDGGSCSGKTSAQAVLKPWLQSLGYTPLFGPETATLLMRAGFSFEDIPHMTNLRFQSRIMRFQLSLEQHVIAEAEAELAFGKPVAFFDTTTLGGFAYMDAATADQVCSELGTSRENLLDRYSALIFLRSAAHGAEQFYSLASNEVRRERSLDVARKVCDDRLAAINGHPHIHIIDNPPGKDFDHKMHRVKRAVAHTLGIPEPLEIERKYVIDWKAFPKDFPLPTVSMLITQTYLEGDGAARVRMVEMGSRRTYTYTEKRDVSPGIRVEKERDLTAEQYRDLLLRADEKRRMIRKIRRTFIWENQYFELDEFLDEKKGLFVLEIELTDLQTAVRIPPFIPVTKDVTDDPDFTNAALARIGDAAL